jgi:hypothetical protein
VLPDYIDLYLLVAGEDAFNFIRARYVRAGFAVRGLPVAVLVLVGTACCDSIRRTWTYGVWWLPFTTAPVRCVRDHYRHRYETMSLQARCIAALTAHVFYLSVCYLFPFTTALDVGFGLGDRTVLWFGCLVCCRASSHMHALRFASLILFPIQTTVAGGWWWKVLLSLLDVRSTFTLRIADIGVLHLF